MPTSGVESSVDSRAHAAAVWPPPTGSDHPAPRPPHAFHDSAAPAAAAQDVRVKVLVRDEVRQALLSALEPVTPRRLRSALFQAEVQGGRSVRFIHGGRAQGDDEQLYAVHGELTVHAVVGVRGQSVPQRGASSAPPSRPAPRPNTQGAAAPVQHAPGAALRCTKLFDERPGIVFFVVFCVFLAAMWAALLRSPELLELPARVTLGGLTLAAIVLRPQ